MSTVKQYHEEFKKQAIKLAKEIGNKAAANGRIYKTHFKNHNPLLPEICSRELCQVLLTKSEVSSVLCGESDLFQRLSF